MDVKPDGISIAIVHGDIHDFPCENNDRVNDFLNEIKNHEHAEELSAFFLKNIKYCNWCRKNLKNSPCCGVWWDIFGHRRKLCHAAVINAKNISSQDVQIIKQLIDIRIKIIDNEQIK